MFQTTVRNGNKFTQEVSTKQNIKSLMIGKLVTFFLNKMVKIFFIHLLHYVLACGFASMATT